MITLWVVKVPQHATHHTSYTMPLHVTACVACITVQGCALHSMPVTVYKLVEVTLSQHASSKHICLGCSRAAVCELNGKFLFIL